MFKKWTWKGPFPAKDYLELKHTKRERLTVVKAGPCDAFGYSTSMLSDGGTGTVQYPVEGKLVGWIIHLPKITPLQDRAAYRVEAWGEEPFEIDASEVMK